MLKKLITMGAILFMSVSLVACDGTMFQVEPTYSKTEGEFILTISVNENTICRGKDINVEAVFENKSGESIEISHATTMIVPIVVGSEWYDGNTQMGIIYAVLEIDEIVETDFQIGSKLPYGKHELVAFAIFDIMNVESRQIRLSKSIKVISNTIILTVE